VKKRRLDGPLLPLVRALNRARRDNPALQRLENISFLETENEQLFGFVKRRRDNTLFVVVNLDTSSPQEGVAIVPASMGLPPAYPVRDLLTDTRYTWHIGRNYVRLGPGQSHLMRVGQ
jgi:starch synthase (maltosyl-transferring)